MVQVYVFIIGTLLACTALTTGTNLPDYITTCSKSDPKLSECAIKSANAAISRIAQGDPKYKVPTLLPLILPEIILDNNQLVIKMIDSKMSGLENVVVHTMNFDFQPETITVEGTFSVPRINIDTNYEIKGQILILPISGNGKANFTFVDNDVMLRDVFAIINKGDKQYVELTDSTLKYTTSRAHFYLENLFNGDKRLGDQMNILLNENWSDVMKELNEGIGETLKTIVNSVITAYVNKVPLDAIFKP